MPRTFPTLQPFYYLDHFLEMVVFLEKHCATLLGPEETSYLEDFRSLDRQAQGLLVRIANRQGLVFRLSALRYSELPDLHSASKDLLERSFFRSPTPSDSLTLWTALPRPELIAALKRNNHRIRGISSLTKPELAALCSETCPFDHIPDLPDFIIQDRSDTLDFLLFLHFGHRRDSLQAFTLRDLGIVRTRTEQRKFQSRFPDHASARSAFFYSCLSQKISEATPSDLQHLADDMPQWPEDPTARLANREATRLGTALERAGLTETAITVYQRCSAHPARERLCRIHYAAGHIAETESLLEEITASPHSDEELLFAEDFHARKFGERKTSTLTNMLREASVILIDEAFRDSPEQAALARFHSTGALAFRTENQIWNALFGILFWDELQGETTHNQFETRPSQWLDGSFGTQQEEQISQKLSLLHSGKALELITRIFESKFGQPNGIFRWRRSDLPAITALLRHGKPSAIETILRHIISDPANHTTGYPDLMTVENDSLAFVEIKAEGDQIRRNQLARMLALKAAGFDVRVTRVQWHVDPLQEYVVVDVETTGGSATHHRITEIGAVRVRGNQVLETYSTLVNPGCPIPAQITRITGITDAMVATAPPFREIAAPFREFLGNAVFVAHNAKFDYAFIREEFARLDRKFRRPTLCTVVASRKLFPGLPSYGLANLCKHFGIPLESHHRALCDATATAAILQHINQKRRSCRVSRQAVATPSRGEPKS